jgi:aminoglycoside phosphotransferase (APT) family kinase protein
MATEATDVRTGEELDEKSLAGFLHSHGFANSDAIAIRQFPAGSSNLTYLLSIDGNEFVLRRPPFGNIVETAHDIRREFAVLSKLSVVYPPAPKPLLFCDDESVIGSEFYLMERRNGVIIRGGIDGPHLSRGFRDIESTRSSREAVVRSFIRNLAALHSLDYDSAGLADLGHPQGYCRRQVEGWTKRYLAAKTNEHPDLESAIVWLNANIPFESGTSLIHNDYKFDNVMLDPGDPTKITAVLDWEMVTIGDPLMDLGTTLGYWMDRNAGDEMLSMPFNPRVLMENVSRLDLVDMYAEASGRELPDKLFYYVFGPIKIAAICQQIYARYVKGFTNDRRFQHFDTFVASLGRMGSTAIGSGSL